MAPTSFLTSKLFWLPMTVRGVSASSADGFRVSNHPCIEGFDRCADCAWGVPSVEHLVAPLPEGLDSLGVGFPVTVDDYCRCPE